MGSAAAVHIRESSQKFWAGETRIAVLISFCFFTICIYASLKQQDPRLARRTTLCFFLFPESSTTSI
jgi:hypothetical protein